MPSEHAYNYYTYTRMTFSLTGNRGELLRSSPKIHPTALMKQNKSTEVEQSYLLLKKLLCSVADPDLELRGKEVGGGGGGAWPAVFSSSCDFFLFYPK